jgi:hypothetical protein
MEFQRGLVRSYDATTHTAAVLLAGSMSRVVLSIPVAHHIAPHLMTEGAACGVAFFAEGSQGVIVCTFDGPATTPGCRVSRTTAKTIPNTTWTVIDFNAEQWDPLGMHDNVTLNTRLTARVGGNYVINAAAAWSVSPAGSWRILQIRLNGITQMMGERHAATSYAEMGITVPYTIAAASYVELLLYQDSGAAATAHNLWAEMRMTGP